MDTPFASKTPTRNIATFSFVTPAPEPGSMGQRTAVEGVARIAPPDGPRIARLRRWSGVTSRV